MEQGDALSVTRLGVLTIGASPRPDVVPHMAAALGSGVAIIEAGALDELADAEIAKLAPPASSAGMVTRGRDGGPVVVDPERLLPHLQARLEDLEARGAALTILLCTGGFPGLAGKRPILIPEPLLTGIVRALMVRGRLGVTAPAEAEVPSIASRWRREGIDVVVTTIPAYGPEAGTGIAAAATTLERAGVGAVLMSCMGYTLETHNVLQRLLNVPVLLPSTLIARVAAGLIGNRAGG